MCCSSPYGRRSHWAALYTPLERALAPGEAVTLHAAHDRERLQLWFGSD